MSYREQYDGQLLPFSASSEQSDQVFCYAGPFRQDGCVIDELVSAGLEDEERAYESSDAVDDGLHVRHDLLVPASMRNEASMALVEWPKWQLYVSRAKMAGSVHS